MNAARRLEFAKMGVDRARSIANITGLRRDAGCDGKRTPKGKTDEVNHSLKIDADTVALEIASP